MPAVDLGHVALTSWSGGRHMHFGRPVEDDVLLELLTPDRDINTILTADVYSKGGADQVVGEAISGIPRDQYRLVGMVGHDFYHGTRTKGGYQRFTDPALRGPSQYESFLKEATERSLERCNVGHFDTLLLHNPNQIGYTDQAVWSGMESLIDAGYTNSVGIAPGPANGFTLDIITCLERFGDMIEWAMLILGPLEPWPTGLVLPACVEHDVKVISRVTEYGGMFWGDLNTSTPMEEGDHRKFRPGPWVETGRRKAEEIAAIGAAHDLTMFQTAAQWTLAQPAVACVAPTIIQEASGGDLPLKSALEKRAELAAVPRDIVLSEDELARITEIGDNTNCMALKGANPAFEGSEKADAWPLGKPQRAAAEKYGISPETDLAHIMA